MPDLKVQVKKHLLKERGARLKEKKSFWCTENETNQFDIYHNFKNTPPSNPMTVETQFALGMRKKLEDAVVDIFDKMGILVAPKPYTNSAGELLEHPDQHRVEMTRLGVPVTGYMDAVVKDQIDGKDLEVPVEIKTSYGSYQKYDLQNCRPKLSYIKQLAQYMDSMGANLGYLFQVHFERDLIIDDIYQFAVVRTGNIFRCGDVEFDIVEDVYKRYLRIWNDYIVPDIEPKSEYVYKYDLKKIDWRNTPKSKIANARSNKAVIGDWQTIYTGYKDLLIEKEGTTPGYTDEEVEYIKEQTKGYTTWDKKK